MRTSRARAATRCTTSSYTLSCTSSRLVELHDWPCQTKFMPSTAASTALSSGASGNRMNGFLPPSSSDTAFTATSAALRWMARPVGSEPTNDRRLTRGWRTMALPTSCAPVTTLSTPGGSASRDRSPSSAVDSEHCSEGLSTIVLPAISAAAMPLTAIAIGWLKAPMRPTTPKGSRQVRLSRSSLPGIVLPCSS